MQGVTAFAAGRPGRGTSWGTRHFSAISIALRWGKTGSPGSPGRAGPSCAALGRVPPWNPDPISDANSSRAGGPVERPLRRVPGTKRGRHALPGPPGSTWAGVPRPASRSRTEEPQLRARGDPGTPRPAPTAPLARAGTHGSIAAARPSAPGGLGALTAAAAGGAGGTAARGAPAPGDSPSATRGLVTCAEAARRGEGPRRGGGGVQGWGRDRGPGERGRAREGGAGRWTGGQPWQA